MCGCRQISTKKLGKAGPSVCAFGMRYCVWLKNNTSCTLFTNAEVLFKKTLKLAKITIIEVNSVEWLQSAAPDGTRESRGEEHWNKVKKKQDSARFSPLQLWPFAASHLLTRGIS